MPVVLQLQNAFKRYGHQELLDGTSCALPDDEKVGLIGRNGAGKSTLCRVLLGEEELDSGELVRGRKLRLGYLRQHDPFLDGETVIGFLQRDSGQPEWRCGEIAWQFQIPDSMLDQPVRQLSGGWQTRVKLAALLLHDPNLLILDEPTNFLDLRTQLLLEGFLRSFPAGCLVVSHDRSFLKRTCTQTLELSRGKLTMFPGDVDSYLENLAERREHDLRVNAATLTKRKQLETFINKNRANANTASQARSKAKQLERLELVEVQGQEATVRFSFPESEVRQGTALRTEQLAIGYPDNEVATEVQLEVEHGTRVGVVGDNGQGKTTFLRTVCGSLKPLAGSLKWGYGCQVGVYAQHVYTTLPKNQTVEDYLYNQAAPGTVMQQIKDVAGSFLFSGDMIEKKINVLSGGERARLVLAGLLLQQHNVLVLDEPGNHLDVETVEALADALCRYRGTVIFTSHDRYFMQRVATAVIEVRDGRVASYPASFEDYVYRVQKELDAGLRAEHVVRGKPPAGATTGPRPVGGKEERELQKQLRSVERKIAKLDEEKKELNARLMKITDAAEAQKTHDQLSTITNELAQLEEEWLEISGSLEVN
ncbi:ABC-F family ATP-binding cassette domain-containing protein [Bythopirellula polymerisocia]|uniref:Putative ABC transporter ATP-binding protein YheS n=1 Tax=Bythopirellula polymerisocia TaxID=2528003 RepID=A0A5C6CZ63_9BACT|nr:ABC-F family ATP-binding cassette domain-containing protein [Bythopirellula polymerisocia]TWU29890.1 putative ABC transporter ATP-binding protein YheS [Bythopirellula polymerisocia]